MSAFRTLPAAAAVAVGILAGIGVVTFVYAEGTSYLSTDPAACANCHTKPFIASSIPALLRRVCDEEPVPVTKFRPDCPEDVERVIAIAMAKKPEQRYETVAANPQYSALSTRSEFQLVQVSLRQAVSSSSPADAITLPPPPVGAQPGGPQFPR